MSTKLKALKNVAAQSKILGMGKNKSQAEIQADRTSQWDRHDSTELIEERSDNWLNDDRFFNHDDEDDLLLGRGDDYCERNSDDFRDDEDFEDCLDPSELEI
jgi:hypothetical protein